MATFYNQATLSYNGNVTVSNITAGEILDTVSAEKTAVTETYAQGSDTAYAISILNTGTADLTGLTVTDDLGAYSFGDPAQELVPLTYNEGSAKLFVNGVLQAEPTIASAHLHGHFSARGRQCDNPVRGGGKSVRAVRS